jgi:hypothetical protein
MLTGRVCRDVSWGAARGVAVGKREENPFGMTRKKNDMRYLAFELKIFEWLSLPHDWILGLDWCQRF